MPLFFRYAIFDCSIYLLRKFDMFFVSLKTRNDINLVASATYRAVRHIECDSTYQKSRKRFISLNSSLMNSFYHIFTYLSTFLFYSVYFFCIIKCNLCYFVKIHTPKLRKLPRYLLCIERAISLAPVWYGCKVGAVGFD